MGKPEVTATAKEIRIKKGDRTIMPAKEASISNKRFNPELC